MIQCAKVKFHVCGMVNSVWLMLLCRVIKVCLDHGELWEQKE